MTVALEDAFGNLVDANSPLTVSLSTTSSKGSFTPISPLTIPAGADTVSFNYTDAAAGTPTLAVASGGLLPATQSETLLPAAASQLAFTTAEQILTAGVPSHKMTVQLEDAFGNPVGAASGVPLSLTTSSVAGQFIDLHGNVLPYPAPLTISAGESTVQFMYADTVAGAPVLTAASSGLASASQNETILADAASQLAFTTPEQVLTAGAASATMTVELEDAFGNPVNAATGPLTVSVSTTSTKGAFSPVSPLTIPNGADTVSFQYSDTAVGIPTLTAAAADFASAAQDETVTPAAASQLAFTSADQVLTAGVPSHTMTIELEDAFGNPVDAASGVPLSLTTTSVAGQFVDVHGNVLPYPRR